ncbi:MAG: hypothetical protein BKP49_02130 [Treponema sp. CETP13]|nr:MAG: hypothetical protein BKP49_02130 [Treponema sp. CETP13]
MFSKRFRHVLFFIELNFLFVNGLLYTQTTPQKNKRPKVAVVLSRSGALGYSQIPVLELLEEENIPIDLIVATSAGSIVGGLYSVGYTPSQIYENLSAIDCYKMFDYFLEPPIEYILQDHGKIQNIYSLNFTKENTLDCLDLNKSPISFSIKEDDYQINLQQGSSFFAGQYFYNALKKLTMRIPSNTDFDTLPIPFRAITINAITGEQIIMDKGDLAEVIRSSISISSIFQPFLYEGNYCIDALNQNDNPVDIAKELGYEIVIDIDFGHILDTNSKSFNNNPLIAGYQMIGLNEYVTSVKKHELADLVIIPNHGDYSLIDYDKASEIYQIAKNDLEKYRPQVKALRAKIFENSPQTDSIEQIREKPCKFAEKYLDNPIPNPTKIVINTSHSSTKEDTEETFNSIKKENFFNDDSLHVLLEDMYNSGNYKTVTGRITKTNDEDELLEINTTEKEPVDYSILFDLNYNVTFSKYVNNTLTFSTDFQKRGILGKDSVLSFKGTLFNTLAIEVMYHQPILEHLFLQFDSSYSYNYYFAKSLFSSNDSPVDIGIKKANSEILFGIPFPQSVYFNAGTGINWQDTTEEINEGSQSYNLKIFSKFMVNTLDYNSLPSKGTYLSIENNNILPIENTNEIPYADILSIDYTQLIPLGKNVSLLFANYIGTNLDENIIKNKNIIPIYGFSTADRQFFPQIIDRTHYGIHKTAISSTLQFSPNKQLTIIGGKLFFSVTGAIGNVWDSFDSITIKQLEWRSSFDTGLRITDNLSIIARIGAGTTKYEALPFISLDLGNIRY